MYNCMYDNQHRKQVSRRKFLRTAGTIAGVSVFGLGAASEAVSAQSTGPRTVTIGEDVTFTEFNIRGTADRNDNDLGLDILSGRAKVNLAEGRIEAVQQSGRSGKRFTRGSLGTQIEFNGSKGPMMNVTFNGEYNGRLNAGLVSGLLNDISFGINAVIAGIFDRDPGPGVDAFEPNTPVVSETQNLGEDTFTNDFSTTVSVDTDTFSDDSKDPTADLVVELFLVSNRVAGTTTADFGSQIGPATTPPQGVTLDSIEVTFP